MKCNQQPSILLIYFPSRARTMSRIPLRSIVIRWRDSPDPTLDDTFLISTGQAHSYPARLTFHGGLESGVQGRSGPLPRYDILIGSSEHLAKASLPGGRWIAGLDQGMSGQLACELTR